MTADASQELRSRMVARLAEAGDLRDPAWRAAAAAVPRHQFIPRRAWVHDGEGYVLAELPEDEWLAAAYDPERTIVTQVDDRVDARPGDRGTVPTSSATMPSIVLAMLDALRVLDGQRVLEIGTGSGYSTALLAERLGDDQVVSVEVDPAVAAAAGEALTAAGYKPRLVTGDGAAGWPAGAPYDRVIATCAITAVPYSWVQQTRPGGLILAPLAGALVDWGLVCLEVGEDGTAAGRLLPEGVMFMRLRGHRDPDGAAAAPDLAGVQPEPALLDPHELVESNLRLWLAGLPIPGVVAGAEDLADGTTRWWLRDPATGSAACLDTPAMTVRQAGPRRLWDLVADTYRWWLKEGRPGPWTFGVTVTPGRQWVWHESGRAWQLPPG
ncbi:methyltransferase domain-containing protein [Carbonactinospora thermoautotrophica]|nr:methyltransferase domain-containing protein [Carbonactinospora thermoautotrophica]MCX9193117.1 methyltransferase domain-containing protein [Carbonactinospora thermoautotrophica]MDI3332040.1 methyltransferase domain-containing protein [Micrococcus sp.]